MPKPIIISPENAAANAWIWDFLEEQRQFGGSIWSAENNYCYQGVTFQFEQTVFARQRKEKSRGYAYEMVAPTRLGGGVYETVYPISCTISYGKTGAFQVKDKKRVVKIHKTPSDALDEYQMTSQAPHLHAKVPSKGYMVMKRMEGIPLDRLHWDPKDQENRSKAMELTKAIFRAYKAQISDKGLYHNDLHLANIMIIDHGQDANIRYEANIIDYGLAYFAYQPTDYYRLNQYSALDLAKKNVIKDTWMGLSGMPEILSNFFRGNYSSTEEIFQFVEEIIISPSEETQKSCDRISAYLHELKKTDSTMAETLKTSLLRALEQSSFSHMRPIQEEVLRLRDLVKKQNLDPTNTFTPVFDVNVKKQLAYNNIFDYFHSLEQKGKALMVTSQKTKGEALCTLVATLREKTFTAAYKPQDEQKTALQECAVTCKQLLKENHELLDTHRDNNYIWAEIGVVLCSLIVLYPIVAAVHYKNTGRIGFFSQTNAAAGAEKIVEDFNNLTRPNT